MTRSATRARPGTGAAGLLLPVAERLFGGEPPVRIRAWDGSEAGPADAPALVLRTPQALRRMMWHPGELGIAQAYVTGELDVDGDLAEALRAVWDASRRAGLTDRSDSGGTGVTGGGTCVAGGRAGRRGPARLPVSAWAAAARAALQLGIGGPPPKPPAAQARVSGRLHSKRRDQAVIAHHYDVPAAFYQLILDPSMAYSAADWARAGGGYPLADAQRDKLDGICAKLALRPGTQLLDVGCGWGSLTVHAARAYGARVTAVTLSREQAAFTARRVTESGLESLVDVQVSDYRDITVGDHDAVAAIEMGEHVGAGQYPAFCALLASQLRPGGRLLIQQMSRAGRAPGGGAFIEAYIAPDMHMRPVGQTVSLLEDAGLEVIGVRAMRLQYARTIRAWLANLERRSEEVTAIVGPQSARVWRLYLAGGALAFEDGRMGVHQILAIRS
ncbi:MAG: cyclopropane-fatty-acyl-phospholipid synthase family protein [Streptosporangiaceae bacterium]|jgi:cyclopropane-fatty-acyl-phospholipid synthase